MIEQIFKIQAKKNQSRKGILKTKRGAIQTPFFMPDATRGFVRSLNNNDLIDLEMGPMVVNTFHLYLKPGMELIKKVGGINNFMDWNNPLLSDSGGYQIFSLIHKNPKMGKITDYGVEFRSPIDGSLHYLTPEKAIEIQFDLGVDMMVVFDDPPPNGYTKEKISQAVKRTISWAKRCKIEYKKQIKKRKLSEIEKPLIFGVIQGGKYLDLREHCAQELVKIGFDGYGFGARHIDEKGNLMEEVVKTTAEFIPPESLRFALGVGTPQDIVKMHSLGWDMFDCVIPTREGRHGKIFLWTAEARKIIQAKDELVKLPKEFYQIININNEKFKEDFTAVDSECDCELCKNHTKAYLRHLFSSKEPSGGRLVSLHNLKFYAELMKKLREEK